MATTPNPAPAGGKVEPIRTWGLDPSWFAFRTDDPRSMVVQVASVAGLAVGLFAALDRFGSTTIGGSEQATQFAWLVSIVGLAAVPIAAAAGADAGVTWLTHRGAMSATSFERAALLAPPVAALLCGVILPPVLFAIGGQAVYLGVAVVILVVVALVAGASYLRRTAGTDRPTGDAPGR